MSKEITLTIQHRVRSRYEVRGEVMAAERKAVEELGGPVERKYKFIEGGERCTFTWTLKQ